MRTTSTSDPRKRRRPAITVADGRIYFSRSIERRVFFVLTLAMLGWGILVRLGMI